MCKGVAFVVVSYNAATLLDRCLWSIINACSKVGIDYEIVVVDNASTDDSVELVRTKYKNVCVVGLSRNVGYASAVNIGVRNTSAPYLIIANSDIELPADTLGALLSYMRGRRSVGVVGPLLVYPNGKWQRSYGNIPTIRNIVLDAFLGRFTMQCQVYRLKWFLGVRPRREKEVGYVDGAFLVTSRQVFEKVRGFSEDFFFYAEDMDYCFNVHKLGYKVVVCRDHTVVHVRGGSSSVVPDERYVRKLYQANCLFVRKHFGYIHGHIYALSFFLHWAIREVLCHTLCFLKNSDANRSRLAFARAAKRALIEELRRN